MCLRLSFGLKNSASTFQRLMHTVFQNVHCVFVYLDDILIVSPSLEEHSDDIRLVCQRLSKFGLTIRLKKCIIGVNYIDFLGHCISSAGSVPHLSKVHFISEFSKPENVKSLQEFLGIILFLSSVHSQCRICTESMLFCNRT